MSLAERWAIDSANPHFFRITTEGQQFMITDNKEIELTPESKQWDHRFDYLLKKQDDKAAALK